MKTYPKRNECYILGTSLWKTLIVRVKDEDGGRGNRNDLFNWAHIIMLNQVCSMLESREGGLNSSCPTP